MIRINIHEAKTHLSKYLARLSRGESIILCNRNVPVAEIRPVARPRNIKRPIGLARRTFVVPASFFEPLPDDEVRLFSGESA